MVVLVVLADRRMERQRLGGHRGFRRGWDHMSAQGPGVLSICPAGEVGPGGLGRYGADTGFRDHAVLTAS